MTTPHVDDHHPVDDKRDLAYTAVLLNLAKLLDISDPMAHQEMIAQTLVWLRQGEFAQSVLEACKLLADRLSQITINAQSAHLIAWAKTQREKSIPPVGTGGRRRKGQMNKEQKIAAYLRADQEVREEMGREPTQVEIAARMGKHETTVRRYRRQISGTDPLKL